MVHKLSETAPSPAPANDYRQARAPRPHCKPQCLHTKSTALFCKPYPRLRIAALARPPDRTHPPTCQAAQVRFMPYRKFALAMPRTHHSCGGTARRVRVVGVWQRGKTTVRQKRR